MPYADVPDTLTASGVIFAALDYRNEKFKAADMLMTNIWNGVTHQETAWDGTFGQAKKMFKGHRHSYKDEYQKKITPQADWLVVTVDYHS